MALLQATARQIPDHAILDAYNKQAYLGNQYSATLASTVGTGETNLLLLNNQTSKIAGSGIALFQNLLRVIENTAAHTVIVNAYLNPTIAVGAQTIVTLADSSGSLNSTFWTFYNTAGTGYYVWYNINSAGVDPAPAGLIGIAVAGATNAANTVIATNTSAAINTAAVPGITASIAGHTVTLTNSIIAPFKAAADGSAATSFTFAVTAGSGTPVTPVNLRPAYGNNSIAQISSTPVSSANGTLVDSISAPALAVNLSSLLRILDAGQSLLITSIASASSTSISTILQWYEL